VATNSSGDLCVRIDRASPFRCETLHIRADAMSAARLLGSISASDGSALFAVATRRLVTPLFIGRSFASARRGTLPANGPFKASSRPTRVREQQEPGYYYKGDHNEPGLFLQQIERRTNSARL
jgi:hypothetical protein